MEDQEQAATQPGQEETNSQPGDEETHTKPDLNECFTFDVGYCKPPRDSWFIKGTSGNPGGRPKGAKNKPKKLNDTNFTEILRDELFRKVKVKGEGTATVSAVRAVTQKVVDLAIGGNLRATQLVFSTAKALEAKDAAQQEADYNYAAAYKARWEDPFKKLYDGPDRKQPVPSPRHIILDDRNRRVMFTGPRNKAELVKYLAGEDFREEDTEEEDDQSANETDTNDDCPEERYENPFPLRGTPDEGDDERLRKPTS
ncbi:MAG: DUF5681 domain-containing protein [Aestuariivirga sp.]